MRVKQLCFLLLGLFFINYQVYAEGFYIGGNLGLNYLTNNNSQNGIVSRSIFDAGTGATITFTSVGTTSRHGSAILPVGRLFAGYDFFHNLAIELGIAKSANYKWNIIKGAETRAISAPNLVFPPSFLAMPLDQQQTGVFSLNCFNIDLLGAAKFQLNDKLKLVTKLGLAYAHGRFNRNPLGSIAYSDASVNYILPEGAIGLEYQLTDRMDFTATLMQQFGQRNVASILIGSQTVRFYPSAQSIMAGIIYHII